MSFDIARFVKRSVDFVPFSFRSSIRRLPLVRTFQRWVIHRYLGGESFLHTITAGPAKGVQMPVTLPGDKLIWAGTWELPLATAISRAVRPGDTCCDIGSYRGFFAGVMAMAGAERVHCFEPSAVNLKELHKFRVANPNLPIEVHFIAIGNQDGEADFLEMPEPTMGKLSTSAFEPGRHGNSTSRVRLSRLDSLFSDDVIGPPAVIKIDVEGAELQVLQGAEMLIRTFKPRLFIEAHSQELARSCTTFLGRLGYLIFVLPTEGNTTDKPREICHLVAEPA